MDLNRSEIYRENCMETMSRLEDESIDLIVTDPPYGMSFVSNHRKKKHGEIHWDNNLDWLDDWSTEAWRVLKNNTHIYVFCSFHNIDIFKQAIEKSFNVKNILIWEKNNTSMGDLAGDYAPKYEMILFACKGRRELNGGRDPNILRFDRVKSNRHPTEKPEALIKYLIIKSTEPNDLVYDPFLGSGTTAAAAFNSSRNYIGSEIDEDYYNTSVERLFDLERQGNLFA